MVRTARGDGSWRDPNTNGCQSSLRMSGSWTQ
jgi:hypothetical protein